MPKIGARIPPLTGTGGDGSTISLAALRGRWVVVYFYPKDNTPGCTREAQDFRDLYTQFQARDIAIIGVSRDSEKSHVGFSTRQELPFPLVADTDEVWCKAFDVIHEKSLYGKRFLGIVRSTFLIAPDGTLAMEWRKVKVPDHAAGVLRSIPKA